MYAVMKEAAEVPRSNRMGPMSTVANSSSVASGLASKKSSDVRFLLSIAIVVLGIAVALWAFAAVHHDFSPDEFGLMTALP
jgi:hypothetical protein